MKMALNVFHTMNHQNLPRRNNRRSELVFELKKILESLASNNTSFPQEVHLTQLVMAEDRIPHQFQHLHSSDYATTNIEMINATGNKVPMISIDSPRYEENYMRTWDQ